MTISFLLSGTSLVWTNRGLLKISELKSDDLVLGLGRRGSPTWKSLESISFHKKAHLLCLISSRNESRVYGPQRVLVLGGYRKAEDLRVGKDRFELCAKRSFFDEAFAGFGYTSSKLTLSISYFLGLLRGCKINGDKISYTTNNVEKTHELIDLIRSVHNDLGIRWKKLYWSKQGRKAIAISPDLINTLEKEYADWNNVPLIVRTSTLEYLKMYALGLIDVFSWIENDNLVISTSEELTVERRFLLNVLSLFGIWPESLKIIHSEKSSYVYIAVDRNAPQKLIQSHRMSTGKGIRFPYLKSVYETPKSPLYELEAKGANWNLCTDFLLLKG